MAEIRRREEAAEAAAAWELDFRAVITGLCANSMVTQGDTVEADIATSAECIADAMAQIRVHRSEEAAAGKSREDLAAEAEATPEES